MEQTISRVFYAGEGDDGYVDMTLSVQATVGRLRNGGMFKASEVLSGSQAMWINIDRVDAVVEVLL